MEIRLDSDALAAQMSEMRQWLDRNGFEPNVFEYRMDADLALCRVDFKFVREAAAFAEAFSGTVVD